MQQRSATTAAQTTGIRESLPESVAGSREWHSLDLALRALPMMEALRTDRLGRGAARAARARLQALVREDRQMQVRDGLREVGAVPVQVERLGLLHALVVWGFARAYTVRAPWGEGVFVKHSVETYARPMPAEAFHMLTDARLQRLPVDEMAVLEEAGPDPYLAVRCGDEWWVVARWEAAPGFAPRALPLHDEVPIVRTP